MLGMHEVLGLIPNTSIKKRKEKESSAQCGGLESWLPELPTLNVSTAILGGAFVLTVIQLPYFLVPDDVIPSPFCI